MKPKRISWNQGEKIPPRSFCQIINPAPLCAPLNCISYFATKLWWTRSLAKLICPWCLHTGKCRLAHCSAHSLGATLESGKQHGRDTNTWWCSPTKIHHPLPQRGARTHSLMWNPTTAGSSPQISVGRAGAGSIPAGYFDTDGIPTHEVSFSKILDIFLNSSLADRKAECLSSRRG